MAGQRSSRRGFLSHTAAVLGAGALAAACGTSATGGDKVKLGSTKEATINWSVWGNDANVSNQEAIPKALKILAEKYPKFKFNILTETTASGGWQERNETLWLAGNGPDVSESCCQWGPSWARQGLLANLDSYIKKDFPAKIKDDFVSWLIDLFTDKEHGQFGLPMYTGVIGLYYHKDLFQKKGVKLPDDTWDWNTYRDAAIRLNDPQNSSWGRRQIRSYDRLLQRLHQAGAHWVDPKDDRKAVFDSAQALQAFQYERDANLKDKYTSREGEYNAMPSGTTLFQAISGRRYAMWEEGSWNLVNSYKQVDKDVYTQWDVAPLPKGSAGRDTLATNDGWHIWKGSKVQDEAWELMKWLESDEWYEIDSSIVGHQPPRKSFQDQWLKLIKQANPPLADKNLKIFTDAISQNYARPIELFRKHKESNDIITEFVNAALYSTETNGAIKNGEKALDGAIKDAVQRINDLNK